VPREAQAFISRARSVSMAIARVAIAPGPGATWHAAKGPDATDA
jgi:hypothetical protein